MLITPSKFLPFYIVFIVAGTFERLISTFFYKEIKVSRKIYYKWTFFVPFLTYLFIVLFSIGEYFLTLKIINITISAIGFVIFVTGVLLRRKSIADLGQNWSVYIEIKESHKLITNGIYRFIKHPYYLAVLFELIGVCLIANAFYSLALVFLIQAPLLLIKILLEEKILINYFGEAYKRYRIRKFL